MFTKQARQHIKIPSSTDYENSLRDVTVSWFAKLHSFYIAINLNDPFNYYPEVFMLLTMRRYFIVEVNVGTTGREDSFYGALTGIWKTDTVEFGKH
jgi:hypothetical protein